MKIISFKGFVHKNSLKNKATTNINFFQFLASIGLDNVDIYLRDGPFSSDLGIVNLHPFQGTRRVAYINEKYFDSYGCICPQKLSKFCKNEIDIV